jgi:hypothetical protein
VTSWRLGAVIALLTGAAGCSVEVASFTIVAPRLPDAAAIEAASSRGWRNGESCRLWVVGIPEGLPRVEEAIDAAMAPVGGVFMRDVIVYSNHPIYGFFGLHCYRIRGEVFG